LFKSSSVFFLISILFLSPEILSSTCSILQEWLSTVFFIWVRGLFIFRVSVWFFLLGFLHVFVKLFYIFCCLLYFTYLFFIVSFVSLWSSFNCFLSFQVFYLWAVILFVFILYVLFKHLL
jgi:hypothetical protein